MILKIMDRYLLPVISEKLLKLPYDDHRLSDHQHGFKRGGSTTTNLLSLTQ